MSSKSNKGFTVIEIAIVVVICGVLATVIFGGISGCEGVSDPVKDATQQSTKSAVQALESTPIPQVTHFQERKTISRWVQRWDKPSVPTYVYIISHGIIIGYYVADGKPASTRSYLTPEEKPYYHGNSTVYSLKLPDIDCTYGDNNPGIRFFTASGIAVEVGGNIGYLYSDAPLPLNVPLLGE